MTPLRPAQTRSGPRAAAVLMLAAFTILPPRAARAATDTVDELNFYNTDLHIVLKTLAERTGNSFVQDIPVEAKVTIHVAKKTPIAEVLDQILRGVNLSWRLEQGVYHVGFKPPPKGAPVGRGLVARTFALDFAPADEAMDAVRPLLSDYGKVVADLGLNAITVTDVSEVLESVKTLLGTLDVEGATPPQIGVQIKLLEIAWFKSESVSSSLQWDWWNADEMLSSQFNDPLNNQGGDDGRGWGQRWDGGDWSSYRQKDEHFAYYPKGLTFKAGEWAIDQVVMRFFAALGTNRAHVLSEPDLTLQDGKESNIFIGERIPTTPPGGFSYLKSGISLKVKARVAGEGMIELDVVPSLRRRDPSVVGNGNENPTFTLQEVNSHVAVVSGGTVRIGGMVDDNANKQTYKVPVLGDIPLIGTFFRRTVDRSWRNELIILVSPHVLERIPPRCATTAGISALTAGLIAGTTDALLDWAEDVPFDNVGVVRYHVYRDTRPILSTGGLAPLSREVRGDLTSWVDFSPKRRGLTYYYAVIAVDGAGNEQAVSNSPAVSVPRR